MLAHHWWATSRCYCKERLSTASLFFYRQLLQWNLSRPLKGCVSKWLLPELSLCLWIFHNADLLMLLIWIKFAVHNGLMIFNTEIIRSRLYSCPAVIHPRYFVFRLSRLPHTLAPDISIKKLSIFWSIYNEIISAVLFHCFCRYPGAICGFDLPTCLL
jgi:hypothetical protein